MLRPDALIWGNVIGMKNTTKIFSAAAVAALALVVTGCGGSGSGTPVTPGTVNANGGIVTLERVAGTSATAAGTDVVITDAGGTELGILPDGSSFVAGDSFAVVPSGTPFLTDLSLSGRAPGDVFVDGQLSRIKISNRTSGSLLQGAQFDRKLILTRGTHSVVCTGPFTMSNGGQVLTIGQFQFLVEVMPNGKSSIPTSILGTLPSNGGSTQGKSLTVLSNSAFGGRMFQLFIDHSNGVLDKTVKSSLGGASTYNDLQIGANAQIPNSGLNSIFFGIQ